VPRFPPPDGCSGYFSYCDFDFFRFPPLHVTFHQIGSPFHLRQEAIRAFSLLSPSTFPVLPFLDKLPRFSFGPPNQRAFSFLTLPVPGGPAIRSIHRKWFLTQPLLVFFFRCGFQRFMSSRAMPFFKSPTPSSPQRVVKRGGTSSAPSEWVCSHPGTR